MFRFSIVLLLINTNYHSLGFPLENKSLLELANTCNNAFLKSKILENISYCNASAGEDTKQELLCLMFFDINNRLCSADLKIDLKEEYSKETVKIQDVASLCIAAQSWTFSSIDRYPHYKQLTEKIFKSPKKCSKACEVIDISSEDSNFHCKYFKWGTDLIENQKLNLIKYPTNNKTSVNSQSTQNTVKATPSIANTELKDTKNENEIFKNKIAVVNDTPSQIANPESKPEINTSEISNKIVVNSAQEKSPNTLVQKEINENVKNIIEKPIDDVKESVIENPKVKTQSEEEDEQDDDEDHDGDAPSEPIGSDLEDDQNFNSDPKLELDKAKSSEKRIESITSFNGDISQREIFPNTIQDTFAEEDDHFFAFFMTTIAVVVLLYILYHNKSKFTKIILGLIVEGRQSGRRRNSRGHAYRRLDTLEQAMSTNTAAPPSKIIY